MLTLDAYLARQSRHADTTNTVFRVLLSLIFIVGGLGHFGQTSQMLARINESPWAGLVRQIGDPTMLLWLSGGVFIVCGFGLALGAMTRLSTLLLFVTLIPVTISIHVAPGHVGPFLKNVAILGGLIHFFVNGPGAHALINETATSRDGRA